MLNKDPDLKAKRGYTHPHSFVREDGSEVLYGTIMIRLLAQLSSESITKLAEDEQPIKESLGDA